MEYFNSKGSGALRDRASDGLWLRCRLTVKIIFTDDQVREAPKAVQIESLINNPFTEGSFTDERADDVFATLALAVERNARGNGQKPRLRSIR
jgi:phage terminase large subunit-like protein